MSALMAHVAGVGVFAPGWPDWASARAGLRGDVAIPIPEDIDRYPSPAGLPRNERRRTSPITRIAFAASEDALANTDCARGDLRSVFASCSGDMDIVDDICRALTEQPVALSPTQFHNSVHNASAGYWGIANQARAASTSLSAFDASFAAGLIEATLQVNESSGEPVLLVCFDVMTRPPLALARPVPFPFAVAMLLSGDPLRSLGQLRLDPAAPLGESRMQGALETLRTANPAARALPLLELVAREVPGEVVTPMPSGKWGLGMSYQPKS